MQTRSFDLPVAVTLKLQSRSGRVHVVAEPRDDVLAETDDPEALFDDGGRIMIVRSSRGGSKPLTVRCPVDTDLIVGTQSGSVRVEGRFGGVHVTTMSGSVEVEDADDLDLRTMSGSLTVGVCRGLCRLNAISGTVTAREVDSASASTVSGAIKIGRVLGGVRVRSVSGDVEFAASGAGPIVVKTISGKVRIWLPEGTEPHTVFKTRGRVRCDFSSGRDCRVEAASFSGSIEVVPA